MGTITADSLRMSYVRCDYVKYYLARTETLNKVGRTWSRRVVKMRRLTFAFFLRRVLGNSTHMRFAEPGTTLKRDHLPAARYRAEDYQNLLHQVFHALV